MFVRWSSTIIVSHLLDVFELVLSSCFLPFRIFLGLGFHKIFLMIKCSVPPYTCRDIAVVRPLTILSHFQFSATLQEVIINIQSHSIQSKTQSKPNVNWKISVVVFVAVGAVTIKMIGTKEKRRWIVPMTILFSGIKSLDCSKILRSF